MKTAREIGAAVERVAAEWPAGALVWHRANGTRGVVCEYAVDGQGCVMILVCFGAGMNWEKCLPCELSGQRVKKDAEEGEEWKDGAAGAGED